MRQEPAKQDMGGSKTGAGSMSHQCDMEPAPCLTLPVLLYFILALR